MKRSAFVFGLILLSAPAWAGDTPAGNNDSMSGGSMNHMTGGSHMSGGMMASNPNCQSMMDEARPKVDAMSDSAMKASAMKQMDMAKMAMDKGQMKSCMSHMHKVMGMMH